MTADVPDRPSGDEFEPQPGEQFEHFEHRTVESHRAVAQQARTAAAKCADPQLAAVLYRYADVAEAWADNPLDPGDDGFEEQAAEYMAAWRAMDAALTEQGS